MVFGPRKLRELGKGLGEATRGFKKRIQEITNEEKPKEIATASSSKEELPITQGPISGWFRTISELISGKAGWESRAAIGRGRLVQ